MKNTGNDVIGTSDSEDDDITSNNDNTNNNNKDNINETKFNVLQNKYNKQSTELSNVNKKNHELLQKNKKITAKYKKLLLKEELIKVDPDNIENKNDELMNELNNLSEEILQIKNDYNDNMNHRCIQYYKLFNAATLFNKLYNNKEIRHIDLQFGSIGILKNNFKRVDQFLKKNIYEITNSQKNVISKILIFSSNKEVNQFKILLNNLLYNEELNELFNNPKYYNIKNEQTNGIAINLYAKYKQTDKVLNSEGNNKLCGGHILDLMFNYIEIGLGVYPDYMDIYFFETPTTCDISKTPINIENHYKNKTIFGLITSKAKGYIKYDGDNIQRIRFNNQGEYIFFAIENTKNIYIYLESSQEVYKGNTVCRMLLFSINLHTRFKNQLFK